MVDYALKETGKIMLILTFINTDVYYPQLLI